HSNVNFYQIVAYIFTNFAMIFCFIAKEDKKNYQGHARFLFQHTAHTAEQAEA
ncbi:hypothetical protein ACJX0J_035805, partial [Zea mays]